jgi:hypothetical protein
MADFNNSTFGKVVKFGSLLSFLDELPATAKQWTEVIALKGGYLGVVKYAANSLHDAPEVSPVSTGIDVLGNAGLVGIGAATFADASARSNCSYMQNGYTWTPGLVAP